MTKQFSEDHRLALAKAAKARCTSEWRSNIADRLRTKIDDNKLRALYESGKTQCECAVELGVTQKIISTAMKRLGIKARIAAKRNQIGSANSSWKGDAAVYSAFHARVEKERGKPSLCHECKKTTGRFEWANLTGDYGNVNDYSRLCVSCHRKLDASRRSETGCLTSAHIPRSRKEAMSC